MTTLRLAAVHGKYLLLETTRVPIAVISALAFPALSLLFFVVPQQVVATNPLYATQAVISMALFAVMANALFSFGLGIAEDREKPWDPYLRTLPVAGVSRVLGYVFSTGLIGLVAVLPVIVLGAIFTAAEASVLSILAGLLAVIVSALPFMLIGVCIGYSLPAKAAIAVVQIVMFGFAFAGGLFLPPMLFAPWLDTLSTFFPSRQARELVIWAVQGGDLHPWVWLGMGAWIVGTAVLALFLYRRDEGRRYR
ncbi:MULTISPECIES: ABC transporter permease [unclassified Cryobacterium]|uniref:ABC transporter permease n=1 Tax=unclassified Cryobacterium TaxID=2649013 RepID=UPI001445A6CC|nr:MULTISPECIES: ABC transporter permease [unclassified Cryobacterium]